MSLLAGSIPCGINKHFTGLSNWTKVRIYMTGFLDGTCDGERHSSVPIVCLGHTNGHSLP